MSLFAVADGSFVRQLASDLERPWDVEECTGGWLVACGSIGTANTLEFVAGDGVDRATLGEKGSGDEEFNGPSALALVPGLGLIVREVHGQRIQVFATRDAIAMGAMSDARVGWMVAVGRAVLHAGMHGAG